MKKKLFIITLPLLISILLSFFITNDLNNLVLPPFMPPGYVFGIIWYTLYLLMGYSLYLVIEDFKAVFIFFVQLIINYSWSFIFFNFNNYLLSVVIVVLLLLLVNIMMIYFYEVNKKASLINLPYFIWLTIALYLASGIFILN